MGWCNNIPGSALDGYSVLQMGSWVLGILAWLFLECSSLGESRTLLV